MKKKVVSMLLCMAMTACVLAGCGSETAPAESETVQESSAEESATEDASVEEEDKEIAVDQFAGVELDVAVIRKTSDKCESFDDKPAFKLAAEATGIKINWIEIEETAAEEQLNIMLASDMPDVFLTAGNISEARIAQEMDSFYDLSQDGLLETYAPNILADYEAADGLQAVTWPDGSIRSLLGCGEVNRNDEVAALTWINKSWLDQLGLDMPTTAEEFYEVLCAFRDNDMNGNGDTTDEIPITFADSYWAGNFMNLANSFGIASSNGLNNGAYMMVKDGKAVGTVNTEEYRAFLEYANKLANEGLLDVEGFSQTTEQHKTKIKEGIVGVFLGYTPRTFFDADAAANYAILKPYQGMEGVDPVHSGERDKLTANRTAFVVSADCENVEAALHWWNYLSSSVEMKYMVRFGEKGQSWDFNEDGVPIDISLKEIPEGMEELDYDYTYGLGNVGPFVPKDECFAYVVDDPNSALGWRTSAVNELWDLLPEESLPVKFTDPEKTEERGFIEIELFDYIANFTATSVVNGVTDESWEAHLAQLEVLQYDAWIDWYQGFIDGEY